LVPFTEETPIITNIVPPVDCIWHVDEDVEQHRQLCGWEDCFTKTTGLHDLKFEAVDVVTLVGVHRAGGGEAGAGSSKKCKESIVLVCVEHPVEDVFSCIRHDHQPVMSCHRGRVSEDLDIGSNPGWIPSQVS
jgi:hypothetical protein